MFLFISQIWRFIKILDLLTFFSENQKVQTVKTFVEDGLQKLKDSEKVKDIVDNETLRKVLNTLYTFFFRP